MGLDEGEDNYKSISKQTTPSSNPKKLLTSLPVRGRGAVGSARLDAFFSGEYDPRLDIDGNEPDDFALPVVFKHEVLDPEPDKKSKKKKKKKEKEKEKEKKKKKDKKKHKKHKKKSKKSKKKSKSSDSSDEDSSSSSSTSSTYSDSDSDKKPPTLKPLIPLRADKTDLPEICPW